MMIYVVIEKFGCYHETGNFNAMKAFVDKNKAYEYAKELNEKYGDTLDIGYDYYEAYVDELEVDEETH